MKAIIGPAWSSPPRGAVRRLVGLAWLLALIAATLAHAQVNVDAAFPGGNVTVERIEGDTVFFRQDLRDSSGDWFYWAFRVRGAEGQTLKFHMMTDKFSARGPAVSRDAGRTWYWMGADAVERQTFQFRFGVDDHEIRFSMGMPYTEAHLGTFLKPYVDGKTLRIETLCRTGKGRRAELLRFGQIEGEPRFRVFLAARHHACEMMASYELEGIIQAVLANDEVGMWFRRNVEVGAVPFMDKDGVEDGDQGKKRTPHDHNRDYSGEPLYPTVAAVKTWLPQWSGGKLQVALDLHCPMLRSPDHELVQFIGGSEPEFWRRETRLSVLVEKHSAHAPLSSYERDNLPFGKSWNTVSNGQGKTFASWVRTLPGLKVGGVIELPYATARGQEVNAESARAYGRAVAAAIRDYLIESNP